MRLSHFQAALLGLAFVIGPLAEAQSSDHRGLWVGEVVLGAVNEVTVPLDEDNVPRAPDPNQPTPTADAANLRLILHVDAAGRTRLLKHVAILSRKAGEQEQESDLALVTDPRLYGAFPPQPAMRISSVAFDFGDPKATAAVDELIERAATAAAEAAQQPGATLETVAVAAEAAAAPVIAEADASVAFADFLDEVDAAAIRAIANGGPTTDARLAADALEDGSFFSDPRGHEMLDAIEAAVASLPATASAAEREQLALNTAAAFAEGDGSYDRFLAGETFGDMIARAAEAAAPVADGIAPVAIDAFEAAAGGSAVAVLSPAHGLSSGTEVAILGAAVGAYNGLQTVVKIDDDRFRIGATYVAGGSIDGYAAADGVAPLTIRSTGHGLRDGEVIRIRDSLEAYDGRHVVSVVDADHFNIDLPFAGDPTVRGVWVARDGAIVSYQGTDDGSAGVKVVAPGHGLDNGDSVEIVGSGAGSYNGVKSITRVDDDSFVIDQAFAGDPELKGRWELPQPISAFAPPAELQTLVEAPAHGLASGDRVTISGAGKAAYNGSHEVRVFSEDSFSIPVSFDAADGSPASAGTWAPAEGGAWRPAAPIRDAVSLLPEVNAARNEAIDLKVGDYSDTRAPDAVERVLDAIVGSAGQAGAALVAQAIVEAEEAGRRALAESVPRYPRPSAAPSTDYDEFVRSDAFADAVAEASLAAAEAAIDESLELIATPGSIRDQALAAAINELAPVYAAASRSLLPELPMSGDFGPAGGGLSVEVVLPANHPTNPFRHRRHPDHTTGIDIRRLIDLGFDAAPDQPGRAGYGVDRISGSYEEEIFGLHKPLGPDQDIGLKVRGRFTLHRISLIDTLNGL